MFALRFYPNKFTYLFAVVGVAAIIAILFIHFCFDESSSYDTILTIGLILIFSIIIIVSLIRSSTIIIINNECLLFKNNIFAKSCSIDIDDIASVFVEYCRAKTINIASRNGSVIKFDCTYKGLISLYKYIPEEKFSVFYIAKDFVPKKHREFLLSTKILKKGKNRGYLE